MLIPGVYFQHFLELSILCSFIIFSFEFASYTFSSCKFYRVPGTFFYSIITLRVWCQLLTTRRLVLFTVLAGAGELNTRGRGVRNTDRRKAGLHQKKGKTGRVSAHGDV